ncbi:MAG: sigma-70 family RNA polymerase sigma factor [Planctomycetes bacterium]|nr:sigma-70 family RNA polymerase sigma factor [Planctomycetota bacterium]
MPAHVPGRNGDAAESLRRLCASVAAGDDRAYQQLHARLDGALRRFLLRRTHNDIDRAEEIAQRTWIAAWDALRGGRFDPQRAAFTTFLYGIAYKLVLQDLRKAGRRQVTDSVDAFAEQLFAEQDDPASFVHACELIDAVRSCLEPTDRDGEFTSDERELLAAVAEGQSERQMAARLGVSPSTVNARKQQAFSKLRDFLGRRGLALPDTEQVNAKRE